jgi:hypothetical protein
MNLKVQLVSGEKGRKELEKRERRREPFFPLLSPHQDILLCRYGIFSLFPLWSHLIFNFIANYSPSGNIFFLFSAVRYEETIYHILRLN